MISHRRFRRFSRLLPLTVATVLSACSQSNVDQMAAPTASISAKPGPGRPPQAQAVKIALLLPLGGIGETAQIARGMKQAAELALFDADNPAVQLITKDDGGTPATAMAAADAAISEGAEIILGPLFGKSAAAVAPIASKAHVPVIAFSNDPSVAGHGVYLMSILAQDEVDRVVGYAALHGKHRFAALIPDTAYGKTIEPAFRAAVAKANGDVADVEMYPADAPGMLAAGKKAVQSITDAAKAGRPVDALFVPAAPETLTQIGPLLAYAGLTRDKLQLLGTSAWDGAAVGRSDALAGGWYAASDPMGWAAFAERYRRTFGTPAPRLATLSFDAMTLALTLAGATGPERFRAENLTRNQGFKGIDGIVRLTPDGVSARGLAVLEIAKDRSVVIDAAARETPQSLATASEPRSRL
jgi:branched-chain amino acid transport system substrate-binding protein